MKWPKRQYTGLSKWLDYLCQTLYWLEYHWPKPPFGTWAGKLMDKYCWCERCQGRYRRGGEAGL